MGRLSYSDKAGFVCAVTSEYCDYFTETLGDCDIDRLRVVSSCLNGHGRSSHGFIVIPWEKFQFEDFDCRSRMFIGHQVAHQWWGETVRPADYKDDWIMEGLSEYCAYWCTERLCESPSAIEEMMDDMKTAAKKGSGMYSHGSKTGSMTLGKRLLSSESTDFYPVVYAKAAYIFHMIRYMLHDYKTNSDDKFVSFLRDIAQTYRGSIITTAGLKELLEKHAGADMSWFFDQWIYGMDIPDYDFDYKTEPASNGKFKVKCVIKQKKVPDDFKMIVPITIIFDESRYMHMNLRVDKPVNEIELPLLPYKPDKIIFNTYDAVLCR
jgi:aminopeptidase N